MAMLPVRLKIDDVQKRTIAILRERWTPILILSFGLGFFPQLLLGLGLPTPYRTGSHDAVAFTLQTVKVVGEDLLASFASATVIAAALSTHRRTLTASSVKAVTAGLPILALIWGIDEAEHGWSLWLLWNRGFPTTRSPMSIAFEAVASDWAFLFVSVAAFLTVGLVTPVILAERNGMLTSLRTALRLSDGSRWPLFGMLVLYGIVLAILTIPSAAVVLAHAGKGITQTLSWIDTAVYHAVGTVWWVAMAASYLELKRLHDGVLHGELVTVFD
ncbi:MAG TPA: hypothetical protein VGL58_20770 [Caulobacteraceae bacterium]